MLEGEAGYLTLMNHIWKNGVRTPNRTGTDTMSIPHAMISHDMSKGFPLMTTKKMAHKTIRVELEGFLNGITSKQWYKDRGCRIWNEWCNPQKVPYGNDPETKARMEAEDDLGPIYGAQWRDFNDGVGASHALSDPYVTHDTQGRDQLSAIVDRLIEKPECRRMVCSAWNPLALHKQALPPCHVMWMVNVLDGKLNLAFVMRSVDVFLGMPFDIAHYGLILHLLARGAGLQEGTLTGFYNSVHLYMNHAEAIETQLKRSPKDLPKVVTDKACIDIRDWTHGMTSFEDYDPDPAIKAEVCV